MPNDAYKRRLDEWEKKEHERKAAMREPPPYESGDMEVRVPLGCMMLIVSGLIFVGWLVYRYLKLHG